MRTDTEWKELYDNASASEYYEERWKDAQVRITAAEGQLAAMREALETIANLSRTDVMIESSMQTAKMVAKQALSAAPKRGRVVWKGNGTLEHTDRDWFGPPGCRRGLTRIHTSKREEDEFDMIGWLEIWGIHGDDSQSVTVTVREEADGTEA